MRLSVDLFRATRMRPCRLEATGGREGPRLCLIDVHLRQDVDGEGGGDGDGEQVTTARASALFLRTGEYDTGKAILDGIGHMTQFVEAEKVASFIRRIADRAFAA